MKLWELLAGLGIGFTLMDILIQWRNRRRTP